MASDTPNWLSNSCTHHLHHAEDWQSGALRILSCACMHTTSILYSQMAQKHYWEALYRALSQHAAGASALPCWQASMMLYEGHLYATLETARFIIPVFAIIKAIQYPHAVALMLRQLCLVHLCMMRSAMLHVSIKVSSDIVCISQSVWQQQPLPYLCRPPASTLQSFNNNAFH